MMDPGSAEVVPTFAPQPPQPPRQPLAVPENGRIWASALDKPGIGVELATDVPPTRPPTH